MMTRSSAKRPRTAAKGRTESIGPLAVEHPRGTWAAAKELLKEGKTRAKA